MKDNISSKNIDGQSSYPDLRSIRNKCTSSQSSHIISKGHFASKKLKFQCVKCKLNFDAYDSLQLHITSPLPCINTATHSKPSKNYNGNNYLSAKKGYRCEKCNLYFSQLKDLDGHMILHSIERRFYNDESDLTMEEESHLEMLQVISDKPFICPICCRGFSNNENLQTHVSLHKCLSFPCQICHQTFSDESLLEKHKLSHVEKKSSISHSSYSNVHNTWMQHQRKLFKCLTCGKEFAHRYYLTNHERIHAGEKPFVCELCSKRFSFNAELKKHTLIHEKPFVCELCFKSFSFGSELNEHTLVHSVQKPFICEICNKGFFRKDTLKIHKITHGTDTSCKYVTEQGLTNGDGLNEMDCGEESYQCDVCNKEFSSFATLHSHERNHTRPRLKIFKCAICTKSFVKRCDLKRHLMTHTGEKPYKCEMCEKAFTRNSHLKTHQMLHTGEKPFICPICNKGYTKRSDMRRHFITHSVNKQLQPEIIVL